VTAVTRLITADDAPALTRLASQNRDFLVPWEPRREENWYTLKAQRDDVATALGQYEQQSGLPHVILDARGEVVGRITLRGITRGAFQSCSMGYWVSAHANGQGLATSAVAALVHLAFGDLRLHRVQAGTLLHNAASQRVLRRNGFTQFGLAPRYLRIAGRWQDHLLFQRLNDWLGEDGDEESQRGEHDRRD
jgi:ribosomal-protein-alanine N-acetyltransferase